MKFLPLAWSNFARNRARLVFTLIANLILAAVFASMLMVTGSSLLQTFRERTVEFGVLKALGLPSRGWSCTSAAGSGATCV
jgi:hypothetical protein